MFQVTYLYEDAEVGHGEGESLEYAKEEAYESLSTTYKLFFNELTEQVVES